MRMALSASTRKCCGLRPWRNACSARTLSTAFTAEDSSFAALRLCDVEFILPTDYAGFLPNRLARTWGELPQSCPGWRRPSKMRLNPANLCVARPWPRVLVTSHGSSGHRTVGRNLCEQLTNNAGARYDHTGCLFSFPRRSLPAPHLPL